MDDATWKNRKALPRNWPAYMRIPRDGCADEEQISLIVAGFFAFAFLTLIGIVAVVTQ